MITYAIILPQDPCAQSDSVPEHQYFLSKSALIDLCLVGCCCFGYKQCSYIILQYQDPISDLVIGNQGPYYLSAPSCLYLFPQCEKIGLRSFSFPFKTLLGTNLEIRQTFSMCYGLTNHCPKKFVVVEIVQMLSRVFLAKKVKWQKKNRKWQKCFLGLFLTKR